MYNPNETLAQCASRYNFDDLLKVLTEWNTPKEVRLNLLCMYFHATQALFNDNGCAIDNQLACAFLVLQNIIEALENTDDAESAKLQIVSK